MLTHTTRRGNWIKMARVISGYKIFHGKPNQKSHMGGVMRKLIYIAFVLLTLSCNLSRKKAGNEINWANTPFVFDGCKMYYMGKEFQLGWHIKKYEEVFGIAYRRVDSIGSFGHDNIFTFDELGIMMLGSRYSTEGGTDTIRQINIAYNYENIDIDRFDEKEGITDKMRIPDNYARPKNFYHKAILLNGIAIQFGPKGISVDEANRKLARVHVFFEKKALASMRFYFPNCADEMPMGQVFSTATIYGNGKVDEFHIGKDFWNED